MRIRLYLDEDSMRRGLVQALRLRYFDVTTPYEAGLLAEPDAAQLEWATTHQRVLFSYNRRDFYRLHAEWMEEGRDHCGIILASQGRFSIGEQVRRLVRIAQILSAENMRNRVEFLSAWT